MTNYGQTELYLEIDSEESDDWNKIQHVIDTLRGVDLCPNDEVLSSSRYFRKKRKPCRFPLGAQWASILATVCLFQKQLLILTRVKRFLLLILFVCRNWLHFQGPCLWNWPGRRPPWLQGPSVQVRQSDLWKNENWKKCWFKVTVQEEKRLLWRSCDDFSSRATVTSCKGWSWHDISFLETFWFSPVHRGGDWHVVPDL